MPMFSVIIPTYHRNDLLAKCLDCLTPGIQTLSGDQYEVIVTDDGRETTAEEMIREHYPWVKWAEGPCKGPAANRNNGSKVAQGKWLVFTDDDCLPDRQWLEFYQESIVPDIWVYEGKTTCLDGIRSPLEHAPINLSGGYLWSCNLVLEKNFFENLNGFDEKFPYPHLEDVDLRDRIQNLGQQGVFVQEAIVDHPPRNLPWGDKLGAHHESDIYYYFCKRNQTISKTKILTQIVSCRMRKLAQHRLSLSSVKFFISMMVEITYVFLNFESWKQKLEIL